MLAERCLAPHDPAAAEALAALLRYEYPLGRILRYQGLLGDDPLWPQIVPILREHIGHIGWTVDLALMLGRVSPLVRASFWWRDRQKAGFTRIS